MGHKHSEETKRKLSEIRIAYLKQNPDKIPYKLNHKHKETYPEKYFKSILVDFCPQYQIPDTLYQADFANPISKVIVEIDGEQHHVDSKIVAHDAIRTRKLEELGWKIIRVRWSSFQKLTYEEKAKVIVDLQAFKIVDIDSYDFAKIHKCECGKILSDIRSKKCIKCAAIESQAKNMKFNPTREELEELIKERPMTTIAKMFDVSDTAVKKRCRKLGIELKDMRGHWRKVETGKI